MLVSCGDCGEVEPLMVAQMYYVSTSYGGNSSGEIYVIVKLDYCERDIVNVVLLRSAMLVEFFLSHAPPFSSDDLCIT